MSVTLSSLKRRAVRHATSNHPWAGISLGRSALRPRLRSPAKSEPLVLSVCLKSGSIVFTPEANVEGPRIHNGWPSALFRKPNSCNEKGSAGWQLEQVLTSAQMGSSDRVVLILERMIE
jgi:hypothetical protein